MIGEYLAPRLTDQGTILVRTRGFTGSSIEAGGNRKGTNTENGGESLPVAETDAAGKTSGNG
jgi:hypothetical protein